MIFSCKELHENSKAIKCLPVHFNHTISLSKKSVLNPRSTSDTDWQDCDGWRQHSELHKASPETSDVTETVSWFHIVYSFFFSSFMCRSVAQQKPFSLLPRLSECPTGEIWHLHETFTSHCVTKHSVLYLYQALKTFTTRLRGYMTLGFQSESIPEESPITMYRLTSRFNEP